MQSLEMENIMLNVYNLVCGLPGFAFTGLILM